MCGLLTSTDPIPAVEIAEAEKAATEGNTVTENDNGTIIDGEPAVEGEQENLSAVEEIPEAVLEPNPEPRRIDMKAKVETTRYLLQARKAYMSENYDSAITALRRAIELNPYDAYSHARLGSFCIEIYSKLSYCPCIGKFRHIRIA